MKKLLLSLWGVCMAASMSATTYTLFDSTNKQGTWTANSTTAITEYTATVEESGATFDMKYLKGTYTNNLPSPSQYSTWRVYQGTKVTITSLVPMKSIKITTGDGKIGQLTNNNTVDGWTQGTVDGTGVQVDTSDGLYEVTFTASAQVRITNIEVSDEGNKAVSVPVFTPASGTTLYAEDTVTLDCATSEATMYWKVNDGDYAEYTSPIAFDVDGEYTVTAYAAADGMTDSKEVSAVYTYLKVRPAFIEDVLTYDVFLDKDGKAAEADKTTYADYTFTSDLTGISYAAQMATGNSSIQLRSNNSNSGIVTTDNPDGYVLAAVEVEWNTNSASGRTLDIYGADEAYSAATELYGNNLKGTKRGSIVKGTSTSLTIENPADVFAGLRSNNGAMYINKITLRWLPVEKKDFVFDIEHEEFVAENTESVLLVNVPEDMTETTGKFTWTCADVDNVLVEAEDEIASLMVIQPGVYTINVAFAGDDVYKAAETDITVNVHPDVNAHMGLKAGETIVADKGNNPVYTHKIANYDETYNYYYLVTPAPVTGGEENDAARVAPEYKTYNDNDGIELDGNGKLSVVIEKNGVDSPATEFAYSITTGIKTIDADAQDARFFTIDGVEVSGNQPGLYIRVSNGKAEKVIL